MLVSSQVAFSLVLLIASGVFVRTLADLRPPDYRQPNACFFYDEAATGDLQCGAPNGVSAELIRTVTAIPGVQAAALAENCPLVAAPTM